MDFEGNMFIAAEHTHSTKVANLFNKLRLKTPNAKGYFNTGVMLMNLQLMRKEVRLEDIYQFIRDRCLSHHEGTWITKKHSIWRFAFNPNRKKLNHIY
jgi:lipopolysaccharide biosynthesis glycosyltransferase